MHSVTCLCIFKFTILVVRVGIRSRPSVPVPGHCLGHRFLFFVLKIFSQQVSVGGLNKNKNKIHSDHFPIELKLKETQLWNWSK